MPKIYKQNLLASSPDQPQPDQTEHHRAVSDNDFEDEPVQTLLTWKTASRPYRKKDRSFYTTASILVILISLIALLAGELILIGALFAFLFLVYVINFVPPEEIEYKLSTQGVTIGDHFYHWQELNSFWFSEKEGHKILNILTNLRFPAMLIIVMAENSEEGVRDVVAKFLPFHEIAPKTLIDRWSDSLQKHFPLENPHR